MYVISILDTDQLCITTRKPENSCYYIMILYKIVIRIKM